nr:hypothetical protein [Tanacetum cinerariifolium]
MVMSGSQRSKEDDVQKISTFVSVTNFPDGYGAKDLWNTCKLYGHVVDVFFLIEERKQVGRNKIHANVARFQRELLYKQSNKVNNKGTSNVNHGVKGKVNEFASLTNLKVVLGKEGYANIELKYMGGFWVIIVFQDDETKKRFQFNLAVGSWFSQIIQAHNDFVIDERVIWVEVEGVPCKWWSRNTFSRITSRWGTLLNGEELEEEGYYSNKICIRTKLKTVVFDSFKMVYRGMTCWVRAIEVPGWVPDFEEDGEEGYDVTDGSHEDYMQNDVHSEYPFGIYEVLNKKRDGKNIDDKHKDSLKYPSGFTPNEEGDVLVEKVANWSDENRVNDGQKYRDPNMFQKINDTVSDYFIMVRGVWVSSGKRLLIISVYAPQDLSQKKMLWDYLSFVIGNWDNEAVIMGYFNEVRDISERWEVVRYIQEVEKVDAMEVAQKAKIKWSIEGDENSKYYHGVLNKKRGRLTIRGILVDGIWMESSHLVKHEFFENFKNRFEKPNKICILLERDFVKRISLEQNDDLEREVSNEEIKRVVWDCGIDKVPGPDGFTFGFYRRYWDIIGNDVVDAVKCLIGSLYKVIAKVLANRLVTVLDDIVDEIQSAFVTNKE